jgi:hypothetical protein
MRYVTSISPATTSPNTRQVMGLSAAQAVKPVHSQEHPVPYVEHHEDAYRVLPQSHPNIPAEDRRKACRRVNHLPVLIELRSGIDRRHHNLREGDVAEHIDIEA